MSMSYRSDVSDEDELTHAEEEEELINIGRYIGGRNAKHERHGKGWAILPNGDQYDGQYRRGRRHGIGLYVFTNGARYFGQYRCGVRSGRGIFIYPDGSYYEGSWRGNLKHGRGRYYYPNGDTYCGGWHRGLRHGVGVYTVKSNLDQNPCGPLTFRGTWRKGVRVGPFQLTFGNEAKSTTMHGTWDYLYPQGPTIFSFDSSYLLMGYFQTPGKEAWLTSKANKKPSIDSFGEGAEDIIPEPDASNKEQDVWADEPSLWFAQEICSYDYSLLPQEPVPLALSDSEVTVCSLLSTPTDLAIVKSDICVGEGEEEGEMECVICECECSSSGVETSINICPSHGDPCAIEIVGEKCA